MDSLIISSEDVLVSPILVAPVYNMMIDKDGVNITILTNGIYISIIFCPFEHSNADWNMLIQGVETNECVELSAGGNSSSSISWAYGKLEISSEVSGCGGDMNKSITLPEVIGKKLILAIANYVITNRDAYNELYS